MTFEFDPAKDRANVAKHGVSLALAEELDIRVVVPDERKDYGEPRFRAWGVIEGAAYCLAFTIRNGRVRPISLRRAHAKEMATYGVPQAEGSG